VVKPEITSVYETEIRGSNPRLTTIPSSSRGKDSAFLKREEQFKSARGAHLRICRECNQERDETEFAFSSDGRKVRHCKTCKNAYNKRWYQQHKKKHCAAVQRNNKRYAAKARQFVNSLKSQPCPDCGRRYPSYVMDFDHVRGEKLENIARMVTCGRNESAILVELRKCELVCSNCHRIRTHKRRTQT
jgi:hypothetical protein